VDTSRHIDVYAGSDAELCALANMLRGEVPQYAEATMAPMAMKNAFFVAESAVKGRTIDGKARRG
jgi:hypothetical protein